MRTRFPALADQVLGAGEELSASDAGFASTHTVHGGARVPGAAFFPRDGSAPLRLRGFGGVDVRVRAIGMFGRGQIEQRAVVYERHGGASLWLAGTNSAEEWLYFEPGQAREVLAAWEVLDGVVQPRGAGVDIVDHTGVVRMSVTSPRGYAASGREVAVALTGSGNRLELRVTPTGEALLIDPLWLPTGMMNDRRDYFTTTPLEDGRVLVAGGAWSIRLNSQGLTDFGVPATGEVYDSETNAWSLTSLMVQPRSYHTATRLTDGRVLIAGGMSGVWSPSNVAFRDVEIYDPSTNAFTPAAAMNEERRYHSATLLADGRVLVVGGTSDNVQLASTEIYDPASNAWTPAAPLPYTSSSHTAPLLHNGAVIVAGGYVRGAQRYDPATDRWSDAGEYANRRQTAPGVTLRDGKVLVIGGFDNHFESVGNLASAVLYDPLTNTWSLTGPLAEGRYEHSVTLLLSGRVLVVGGYDYNGVGDQQASAELYDPATNTWSATVSMAQRRALHGAALLPNGEVLVAGGYDEGTSLATAERYSQVFLALGAPCTQDGNCSSGFCADRVCCDGACNAGDCDACSLAAGAAADGTCSLLSNTLCETGRICWEPGTCEQGICAGAQPVPDGTPCGSGACDDGACGPAAPAGAGGDAAGHGGVSGAGENDAGDENAADASTASAGGDAGDSGAANNGDVIDAGDSGTAGDSGLDPSDSGSRMDGGGDLPSSDDAPPVDGDRLAPRPLTSGAGPGRGCACEALGTHRSARPPLAHVLGLAVLLLLRRRLRAVVALASALLAFGCHGGRLTGALDAPCSSEMDCKAPFVCDDNRCREACQPDAGCPDTLISDAGLSGPVAGEQNAGASAGAAGTLGNGGVSGGDAPGCTPVDDHDSCTDDVCARGMPIHRPARAGTSCSVGGTRCDGDGGCVECVIAEDCTVDEPMCSSATCERGTCMYQEASAEPCDDGDACSRGDSCEAGACVSGQPVECRGDSLCVDGTCVAPRCSGSLGLPAPAFHVPRAWPVELDSADFNDDERPDLVVGTAVGFTLMLGHSEGGFTLAGPYLDGAMDVVAGDFDGDGLPDIASVSQVANVVVVALNPGDATFEASVEYAVAGIPSSVVTNDLNGDGALDLAVACSGVDGIDVLLNEGDGTFAPATTHPAGRYVFALTAADLNADGRADLAAVNLDEYTVSVLLNEGAGAFSAPQDYVTGPSPYSVAAADLNGDALPELVVANHGSNDVSVFVNAGAGTFVTRATFGVGMSPIDLALEDLNDDGLIDIAVADSNGDTGVSVLLNRGDASFDPALPYEAGTHPRAILATDLDGDANVDLVVANSSSNDVSVLSTKGDTLLGEARRYGLGPYDLYARHPESIAVGDLDGDPFADFAVSSDLDNSVDVVVNDGGHFPRVLGPFAVGSSPETVIIADLNGDGARDVATSSRDTGSVSVLLNSGEPDSPAFGTAVAYPAGPAPIGLVAADLNNDARPDLIVTNYTEATVSVLGNLGDGTFAPRSVHATGGNPFAVIAADLDRDEDLDVITANLYGDNASVLINVGAGALAAPVSYAAGEGGEAVVATDLNGDGLLDLALANELSQDVTVLFNEGGGRFHAPARYPAGPGPSSLAAADLDGDNDTDLAVANQYGTRVSTLVSVFLNRGEGTFDPALYYYRVGANPRSIAAADVNADNRPDLLVANGNTVSVMLNACLN